MQGRLLFKVCGLVIPMWDRQTHNGLIFHKMLQILRMLLDSFLLSFLKLNLIRISGCYSTELYLNVQLGVSTVLKKCLCV